jgi:hypothetical protein
MNSTELNGFNESEMVLAVPDTLLMDLAQFAKKKHFLFQPRTIRTGIFG